MIRRLANIVLRRRPERPRRRARRGMNLLEVMIAVGIILMVTALLVPFIWFIARGGQASEAQRLAITYALLHDEAQMRNVTFRVAYHLEEGCYEVEVGDPNTLVFTDPDKREEYEKEIVRKFEDNPLDPTDDGSMPETTFTKIQDQFVRKRCLPSNARFGGVYTPQYGEMVRPSDEEDEQTTVYSHVFPNGFAEHTVVHIVRARNPDVGTTLEVDPLTGRVFTEGELKDWDERLSFVPDEGPELD